MIADEILLAHGAKPGEAVIDSGATATILTSDLAEKLYAEGFLGEVEIIEKTFSTASGTPLRTTAVATLSHPSLADGRSFVAPPESGLKRSLIGSPQLSGKTLHLDPQRPTLSGVKLTKMANGHFHVDLLNSVESSSFSIRQIARNIAARNVQ